MKSVSAIRRRVIGGLATLCVAIAPAAATAADYPEMTIKFGDVATRNFGYYQGMLAFQKAVQERSGGKIKVEILTDGVLGTAKDVLEAAQLGTVQMVMNTAAYTQNIVPEHGVWNLPYLFDNREEWRRVAYGPIGQELGDLIEARGLKFLTWNSAGGRGILSKEPFAAPADFSGQKIRTMPDPVIIDTVKAINGQPVTMHLPEVFTSLQQGILDGADVSIELVTAFKLYEAAKFYTETKHIMTPGMVVANLKWWNGLNDDTKSLVQEAIMNDFRKANDAAFIELDNSLSVDQQTEVAKILASKGVTIVKPDLDAVKKATRGVVEQYKKKIGGNWVERIMAEVHYQ